MLNLKKLNTVLNLKSLLNQMEMQMLQLQKKRKRVNDETLLVS